MPAPIYKANANTWKQIGGVSFGTTEEGMDWVQIRFRGPVSIAENWRR